MRQDFWSLMLRVVVVGSVGAFVIVFAESLRVTENAAIVLGILVGLGVAVLFRRREDQ